LLDSLLQESTISKCVLWTVPGAHSSDVTLVIDDKSEHRSENC